MLLSMPTVNILDSLHMMKDEFHLTGSQFFMGVGNDIDYFVQYRYGLEDELVEIGFVKISNSRYGDSNTQSVMRAWDKFSQRQIDIQICEDAELKKRVQQKLKDVVGLKSPTQEQWNLAFALLK